MFLSMLQALKPAVNRSKFRKARISLHYILIYKLRSSLLGLRKTNQKKLSTVDDDEISGEISAEFSYLLGENPLTQKPEYYF
jgi:hypothetical protein